MSGPSVLVTRVHSGDGGSGSGTVRFGEVTDGGLVGVDARRAVASRLGFDLTDDEAKVALRWVKQTCYRHIAGTLDDEMFATFLRTQKLGTAA